jgi:dTDP-glucose 4,6-dehydratase
LNALKGKPLPIYGDGLNVRDWLYVEDHCEALRLVLEKGGVGEVYNIGGRCERTNIEIVNEICALLDRVCPNSGFTPYSSLITYVKDRPGHDRRYAINSSKIEKELGWRPKETFETGLEKTIRWYLENSKWVESVQTGAYRDWIQRHYPIEK